MPVIVSVVMSVYNDQAYVSQAIESILGQTFSDFEIIVIDDGSTDNSAIEAKKFTDSRIRFFQQSNSGLARSLNFGITVAQGKYIARQDSDDFSMTTRLEQQMNFLDTHPEVSLVGCNATLIDQDGIPLTKTNLPIHNDNIQQNLMSDTAGNPFIHGATMFRRDCALQAGLYRTEFRQAQDLDLWLRIAEKSLIANLQGVGYLWRLRRGAVGERNWENQRDYSRLARLCAQKRRVGESEPALSLESVRRESSGRFFSRLHRVDSRVEYEMKIGILLFDAGRMMNARSKLFRVVSQSPFYLYAWLLLVLSLLPHHLAIGLHLWAQNIYHKWIWND